MRTKKQAVFVVSAKGGSGKSTWARAYLDRARAAGLKIAAYDGDGSVGQLVQYYGTRNAEGVLLNDQDPVVGVLPFDVRDRAGRDTLVTSLETDADGLLFDLPGGSVQELGKVLGGGTDALFDAVRKYGFEPVVVVVITPLLKSTGNVLTALRTFGSGCRYVAVKNLAFGPEAAFRFYDRGKGRLLLRISPKNAEITMPALDSLTYAKIDAFSMTFADLASGANMPTEPPAALLPDKPDGASSADAKAAYDEAHASALELLPNLADRMRVDSFLKDMAKEMTSAGLLPSKAAAEPDAVPVHAGMVEEA